MFGNVSSCEDIVGEEGLIVNDPIHLDPEYDFDIGSLSHQNRQFSHQNREASAPKSKEENPTLYFNQCIGFVDDNCYFQQLQDPLISIDGLFLDNQDSKELNNRVEEVENTVTHPIKQRDAEKIDTKKSQRNHIRTKNSSSQTKNIPKNYGKQIIKFIQTHQEVISPVLECYNIGYTEFVKESKILKKQLNRIIGLKTMWSCHKYSVPFRIITEHFLRKYSYEWIFNSRIEEIKYPIKFRRRILEGVREPQKFDYIKNY